MTAYLTVPVYWPDPCAGVPVLAGNCTVPELWLAPSSYGNFAVPRLTVTTVGFPPDITAQTGALNYETFDLIWLAHGPDWLTRVVRLRPGQQPAALPQWRAAYHG